MAINARVRSSGGAEKGQSRKKARSEGSGVSGTNAGVASLRVDVNALRLPSPRRDSGLRRSPIAFDLISGDGSSDETGDATNCKSK